QLEHLVEMSERPNLTLQVLPQRAGLHGLSSTDVWFLRLPDARTVAYTENGYGGDLIEENAAVERVQRVYDATRDLALSPAESRIFTLGVLEELPWDRST
ncbi:Scr1 family TA system antitoxin-like transcriptional regulator, partial [Streptomyces cyaneofuscatus]